jgi:hypothetical protein
MPTEKPRIQVTLKPSQYALFKRLAELRHRPMAAIIAELVDEIEPVYERLAVVLQAAVRAQASVKEGRIEAARRAELELAPIVARAMSQLDFLSDPGMDGNAAGFGRPSGASAADPASSTPASVTRGSGLSETRPRTGPARSPPSSKSPRKSRALRVEARKSPGRSVRSLAASIARQVRKGPKGHR